ncbi:MAG: hypothetical protein GXX83_06250 [Gaiellales bacterium]|nr:hypothetical protein [Gaiellales bacterium]
MEQEGRTGNVVSAALIDHAQRPRNNFALSNFSGRARITGPCGDTMEFWVQVRDNVVEQATFTTDGCAISHACGSMTTCMAEGRPLTEIEELGPEHVINAFSGLPEDHVHCALLSTNTLKAACADAGVLAVSAYAGTAEVGAGQDLGVTVRVAVPVAEGRLCPHFGHCESFTLVDVESGTMRVLERRDATPPPHEPGVLPRWLGEQGVQVVICGGMGEQAQELLADEGIQVVLGVAPDIPEHLISDYISGKLQIGENTCDH